MHELVVLIAKYFIALSVLGAAVTFFRLDTPHKKRFVIAAIIGAVVAVVLAKIGSKLFYNPRPFVVGHFKPWLPHGNDNGFPSDHTLLASYLAALCLWYSRKLGAVLFAIALAIGLARVAAGVHHLIDIIGAIICGTIGAYAGNLLAMRIAPRHHYQHESRRPS
ncbi:MAG TPA: phosphatase PAP2 family protein [Candidatus Saccharimonadales bacterium]|nr:phosphatase PAP2 family protein [Candidatus Saccharimonadales bacterium]